MEQQKLLKRKNRALLENNQTLLLNTCTDLANFYMVDGRYEKAITEYTTIADIYKEQNKIIDYARACRGIGEAYMGLQQFDKGLKYQFIFLDLAKEQNNKLEEQRALATIGHTYLTRYLQGTGNSDKEDLNLAKKFLMKSLVVCESLSNSISKLEHADMSARLFSNLGLVEESLGSQHKALELIRKSINICKTYDIYEQLQRGYMSLASLLEKQNEYNSAIHNYNLAIEVTKKLDNKLGLMPIVLSAKADVLVKLGDIKGAKTVLRKAYKLRRSSNCSENDLIERNLKVVTLMSKNENKLLTIDQTNYIELKKLYEEMGDAACYLKCYSKALDYYKKMLEIIEKSDTMNDRELVACYYSLAETYKDNNQFHEAIDYYEKEYELNKHLFKDSLDSLCRIADTKELADCSVNEIQTIYDKALNSCRKERNVHEEGRILKRFIIYLKRHHEYSKASEMEKLINQLNYVSSESESEDSDLDNKPIIGDNISLEDVTDDSNESDEEDNNLPSTSKKRRRTKNFIIKRNLKGETQLHTACINGKINVVRHLLEQNHPVNVRDNCGWLPLHEACIWGHLDIVELLLEKGAAINDRGGTHCNGITPIYDAASNGHLEIVQLLLSKGASAIVKTDDGDTVLDILKKWHSSTEQLDENEEQLYQNLIEQISKALDAVGHHTKQRIDNKSPKFVNEHSNPNRNRHALIDLVDLPATSANSSSQNRFADDYRNVIENLRHKNASQKVSTKTVNEKRASALVESNDAIDDDWLEDDLSKTVKKRKTGFTESYITTNDKRSENCTTRNKLSLKRSKSFTRKASDSSIRSLNENRIIELSDENDDDFEPYLNSPIKEPNHSGNSRKNLLENQNSLPTETFQFLNSEFSSRLINSPINNSPFKRNLSSMDVRNASKKQLKLTDFPCSKTLMEADSTTITNSNFRKTTKKPPEMPSMRRSFEQVDPTLTVDIKINERLYRVPVLLSQVNTHTIKWLAEEAASRYARKEYIKPTIELETKEGAVLANDDLINLLFPMGVSQTEQLTARVIKWNLPPLSKRYKDACSDMNIKPNDKICNITEQVSTVLDLSNLALKDNTITPLFKALNRQINLLELDLSGNYLTTDCIHVLRNSLISLQNLIKLNLSCTGLSSEHIHCLAEGLNENVLQNLLNLDISDNSIGDQSLRDLSLLTRHIKLTYFNLSSNKFTRNIFNISYNRNVTLVLDYVDDFDLSDNELSQNEIKLFVSWLKPLVLKSLNVSRNLESEGFLKGLLDVFMQQSFGLENLNLSRCAVQDSELFDLLGTTPNLQTVDLSYNNKLTGISLRRLLQNQTLKQIKLYGCDNIVKYFENCSETDLIVSNKQLKISLDCKENCQEFESLANLWKQMYGDQILVETIENFTSLSV